jgi:hypothetical protein
MSPFVFLTQLKKLGILQTGGSWRSQNEIGPIKDRNREPGVRVLPEVF